jgi:hypothetical protein
VQHRTRPPKGSGFGLGIAIGLALGVLVMPMVGTVAIPFGAACGVVLGSILEAYWARA